MSSLIDIDDDASSPTATLAELKVELDSLEETLKPLLARPWRDTVGDIEDHLQKAKIGVMTAYTICDLIWIFLRTKGVDSANHPVMRELDRIKTYYMKVKEAETAIQAKASSSVRSTTVNVPAAARVLKHALPSKPEDFAGPGMHSRFKHVDREDAEVEKILPGQASSDSELEATDEGNVPLSSKKRGKRPAEEAEDEPEAPSEQSSGSAAAPAKDKSAKKNTQAATEDGASATTSTSKTSKGGGSSRKKKQKKA